MRPAQTAPCKGHRPRLRAPAGLLPGTVVLTRRGECLAEEITVGDCLITRDSGFAPVTGVSHAQHEVRAVFFAAGSLGDTRPEHDLILPAGQEVLIRDWRAGAMFGAPQALAPAGALIDGEFIRDLGVRTMTLVQLHFANRHVIFAGGLELAASSDTPLRAAA